MSDKILCAACWVYVKTPTMRFETHIMFCSARHYDPCMRRQIERMHSSLGKGVTIRRGSGNSQGFLDANGMYLTREEALKVARENNQILDENEVRGDELFSEDLY